MSKQLRVVVSVGLLAWFAWRMDWGQVAQAFAQLRLELWLGAVALYIVTQIVSAFRWQLLAQPLGFRRPLGQFVSFYFIGMFFNMLLPTSVGGDVVRAWYLDGRSGRRLPAFFSVFIDRFSGLLFLIGLACVAVLLCPVPLRSWIPASVWGITACAVLGLTVLPLFARFGSKLEVAASKWRLQMRRVAFLFADSFDLFLAKPRLLIATAGLSLLVQAANVVIAWMVGQAIGAPVPDSYYWIMVPMITLLTLLPISLNGMGVREGGTILFLAPLGVDDGTAISLAFLWFCVFAAASLCGALIYLFGSFPRPEEQLSYGPLGDHSDQGRARQSKAAA